MSENPPTILSPRVLIPFLIVSFFWGTTWYVIQDQLNEVPPTWSVVYRFMTAAAVMAIFALVRGDSLRFSAKAHGFILLVGFAQFSLNFNFVYRAGEHLTSGLIAVLFALLILPNAVFARIFLGQKFNRQFVIGSTIAVLGVAALFYDEFQSSGLGGDEILIGVGFTVLGILSASAANVMQGSSLARSLPMSSMLAWAMFYGVLISCIYALFTVGPPVYDYRIGYSIGIIYLGVFASALTFFLYFGVVRAVGPATAAYSSLLVPVIAMAISTMLEGYVWTIVPAIGVSLTLFGLVVALRAGTPIKPTGPQGAPVLGARGGPTSEDGEG